MTSKAEETAMRLNLPAIICLLIVVIIFGGLYICVGDGGVERLMTFSGIYAVDAPAGQPVVCFVERSSMSTSCVPKSLLK